MKNVVERRRSTRVAAFNEEAALIHLGAFEIPVRLVDLSRTGLLFSFIDLLPISDSNLRSRNVLDFSIAHQRTALRLRGRLVRETPMSVAVEFVEVDEHAAVRLEEKLHSLGLNEGVEHKNARAAGLH